MKSWSWLILVFTITSCTDGAYTEDDFGRELFKSLASSDTASYNDFYLTIGDSSRLIDSSGFVKINYWISSPENYSLIGLQKALDYKDWRNSAAEFNIGLNTTYLRTEVDTSEWSSQMLDENDRVVTDYWKGPPVFKVFFTSDTTEYFFRAHDVYKVASGWKLCLVSEITTEALEKAEWENTPYKPFGLNFTHFSWLGANCNTFENFFVTLANRSDDDFDYVQYKVIIRNSEGAIIFSKTTEINEKIFSRDVMKHEVTSLRNYFIGMDLCESNDLDVYLKVLDARPKPEFIN